MKTSLFCFCFIFSMVYGALTSSLCAFCNYSYMKTKPFSQEKLENPNIVNIGWCTYIVLRIFSLSRERGKLKKLTNLEGTHVYNTRCESPTNVRWSGCHGASKTVRQAASRRQQPHLSEKYDIRSFLQHVTKNEVVQSKSNVCHDALN